MNRILAILLILLGTAQAASKYETTALAEAKQQSLTAAQVAAKKYPEVAELAGVKLTGTGGSPKDFFYVHVRRYVVDALTKDEQASDAATVKVALEAVLASNTTLQKYKLVVKDDGSFEVQRK